MSAAKPVIRWGALWRQVSKVEPSTHVMWEHGKPLLFDTRKQAKAWIDFKYGYIRNRRDLREEPHCWRLPVPVRVVVSIKALP